MEVAMEVEDDLFFADLSRQISLLIMDEDDDPVSCCSSVSLQSFTRVIHPPTKCPHMCEQNCRRESKGTGVFIPQSPHSRRRQRQAKSTSFNTKSHMKPQATTMVSQLSFNSKRS